MYGIRQVIDSTCIPLDIHKRRFIDNATIPENYLENERQKERIVQNWNDSVRPCINKLCRARRCPSLNPYTKRAVFRCGMENLCTDFSRQTETIQLKFHEEQITVKNKKIQYSYTLTIMKLDPIPDSIRNARFCTAEIPSQIMQETDAVLISSAEEQQQQLSSSGGNNIISVPFEMLDIERSYDVVRYIPYVSASSVLLSDARQYTSPPIATVVTKIDSSSHSTQLLLSNNPNNNFPNNSI